MWTLSPAAVHMSPATPPHLRQDPGPPLETPSLVRYQLSDGYKSHLDCHLHESRCFTILQLNDSAGERPPCMTSKGSMGLMWVAGKMLKFSRRSVAACNHDARQVWVHAGSGAYVPGAQPSSSQGFAAGPAPVTGGGADPFTGTNARQRPPAGLTHIPARNFYIFDTAPKADAIGGKIREFSSGLSASADTADLALSEAEVAPGGVLDTLLSKYGSTFCSYGEDQACGADATEGNLGIY